MLILSLGLWLSQWSAFWLCYFIILLGANSRNKHKNRDLIRLSPNLWLNSMYIRNSRFKHAYGHIPTLLEKHTHTHNHTNKAKKRVREKESKCKEVQHNTADSFSQTYDTQSVIIAVKTSVFSSLQSTVGDGVGEMGGQGGGKSCGEVGAKWSPELRSMRWKEAWTVTRPGQK